MILSVSRRTDIPALYSDWFMNRLRAGEVLVRNPMNPNQVSLIPLSPENIDCIVFWTKDPRNLMKHLDEIYRMGYQYYFSITINPYGRDIESHVDEKKHIIDSFRKLSEKIGKQRVIWRYNPILFSDQIDAQYHLKWFDYLAGELGGYTEKCVFTFLEVYKKLQADLTAEGIYNPETQIKRDLIEQFSFIARSHSIALASCRGIMDFRDLGVENNKCIDDVLIEKILGCRIKVSKETSQREKCHCVVSRDIGTYNTCTHGCVYCYANIDKRSASNRHSHYNPESPLLCDSLTGDENITRMKNSESLKVSEKQGNLFPNLADNGFPEQP